MPYRRLPNTDSARIKVMRKALLQVDKDYDLGINIIPFDLVYKLRLLSTDFEQAVRLYNLSLKRQVEASKEMREHYKKAKLYISHFIQVFNMAIVRGDISRDERKYLNLLVEELTVPHIRTEKQLLKIGRQVIQGEEKRLQRGLSPITNPNISLVKVFYNRFEESYIFYKKLQEVTEANLKNVAKLRPKIDSLIQAIWNKVEKAFDDLPSQQKRQRAMLYGVVYFYRKGEREVIEKKIIL